MPSTATTRLTGISTSVAVKAPVKVAVTTPVTLSGEQTIDGVACVEWDRVLVAGQTNPIDNGIYDVQTGAWVRSKDFDGNRDVVKGTRVNTKTGFTSYRANGVDPLVIGTSAITFGRSSDSEFFINFDDYGVQDGITDDSAALVTALADADGGILLISGDVYLASDVTAPSTVWVISQGTITTATDKVFTAMLITHQKEQWVSGFNGVYDPRAFGMYPGLGATVDMAPRLDAMRTALAAGSTLSWPNGVWVFNTKPAVNSKQFIWDGLGQSNAAWVANYNEAVATNAFVDFVDNDCNGTSFRGFQLLTGAGKTQKIMLRFISDSNGAGFVDVRQCVITYGGGGGFTIGLDIDGSANVTPGGQGYRDVYLEDVYVFDGAQDAGVTPAVRINNGVNIHGDLVTFGGILITGTSADHLTQSIDCKLNVSCNQTLKIDYATLISINGFANRINMTANASYIHFSGMLSGPDGHTIAGVMNVAHSQIFLTKGTGVIASGETSVVIAHNCLLTPQASQIHLNPTNIPTSDYGTLSVDTITASQFTVHCRADPGASTLTFSWYVDATRGSST